MLCVGLTCCSIEKRYDSHPDAVSYVSKQMPVGLPRRSEFILDETVTGVAVEVLTRINVSSHLGQNRPSSDHAIGALTRVPFFSSLDLS